MFPLRDDNPTELTPYVAVFLIMANVAVWLYLQGAGASAGTLLDSVCRFGAIPAELTGGGGDTDFPGPEGVQCQEGGLVWSTLLTSMFLHGSWLHLIGNMWFLWLFGNNVEDSMGHVRFLAFYLLTGLAADAAHVWSAPGSHVPVVGASGAISGLMGAYLVLYPRVRIQTLFVLFVFVRIIPIPAWLVLGQWFAIQLLFGFSTPTAGGGVAFWAHVGGFAAGLLLVKVFENRQLTSAKRAHVQLRPEEIRGRGWW